MSSPLRFALRLIGAIEVSLWLRTLEAIGWTPRVAFYEEDIENWIPEGLS